MIDGIAMHGDAGAMPRFRLTCLGDFHVRDLGPDPLDPPRGRKARALVAILARAADRSVTRERVVGLLWSERGEAQARASLRQTLFELRAFCHATPALISAERERVALTPGACLTDLEAVERAAQADDCDTLVALLSGWQGAVLGDLDGVDPALDEWLVAERARAEAVLLGVGLAAAERRLAAGDARMAGAVADRLEPIDPGNEMVARLAIRADAELGDLGSAHARFDRLEAYLDREYGARPSPETRALVGALEPPMGAGAGVRDANAAWSAASNLPPRAREASLPPLIIVTPLATLGGGADAQMLADGATDDIAIELARYRDLRVMTLPTADDPRLQAAARGALGAYVLKGSVREMATRAKVNLALTSIAGVVVWSENIVLELGDFTSAIDAIVRKVVGAAGPVIAHEMSDRGGRALPDDPSVLIRYFRARAMARSARTAARAREAAAMLEDVVAADPALVEAQLHLARLYNTDFLHTIAGHDPAPLRARALELTLRAVELDPHNAHAQRVLGWCHMRRSAWEEAERCFATTIVLHPFNADEVNAVAVGYCCLGDLDQANRLARQAIELSPFPHFEYRGDVAMFRFFEAKHLEAERMFSEAQDMPLLYRLLRLANLALAFSGGARVTDEAARARAEIAAIWEPGSSPTPEATEDWLWSQIPLRRDADRALFARGLAAAGLLRP